MGGGRGVGWGSGCVLCAKSVLAARARGAAASARPERKLGLLIVDASVNAVTWRAIRAQLDEAFWHLKQ